MSDGMVMGYDFLSETSNDRRFIPLELAQAIVNQAARAKRFEAIKQTALAKKARRDARAKIKESAKADFMKAPAAAGEANEVLG